MATILSYLNVLHYIDVIMGAMAHRITSLTIVYSAVYSGIDQRKHQSSASLGVVKGIHRGPANSPHKWPVTRKKTSIWWRHHEYKNHELVASWSPLPFPSFTTPQRSNTTRVPLVHSRNGWAWRHAIEYDSYDQLYWTKRLLYASYIDVSLHRHRCLVILNQSEAIRLFDLPISQTDRKGMAKLVIIGPLWGEFVSGRWSRLTKVSNILITDAIREISFSLVMDVFWTILYADRSHNQHILSTTR